MTRLFSSIKPNHYTLALKPNFSDFTFSGEETIRFEVRQSAKALTFHALDLTIEKVQLHTEKGSYVPTISFSHKDHTVTFSFSEEIPTGEYELTLSYTGILSEKMKGWYRSEFEDNGKKHIVATTQFEEIGARQALVCIDEPEAKAVFDVILIVPKDMVAISNTIEDEEVVLDDYKKVHFQPTPLMSTYLLAFIVGEFEYISSKTKSGVEIRAFATPGKKKQLSFALDIAVRCLDFYAVYFDTPYPLPVLDLIALPDFDAGAMENWGAVTFREAALLVDEEKSSYVNKQWVALVVAHELAHMWFGNLVTMEWWTHLWLNEGFACYIEYLAIDTLFPDWKMWEQFAVMEHVSALSLDSLASAHPIEVPIKSDQEVKEIFDEISYAKGASIIQMLATYLGPTIFRDGLRYYLKKNSYKNTVTEQLWEAFEFVSKQPIRKIMQEWTQKSGYPILTVDETSHEFTLSQKRFFASSLEKEKYKEKDIWSIPLHIIDEQKDTTILFDTPTFAISKKGEWLKINAGETSLVRVIYTKNLLERIEKKLYSLSSTDRMGIIRDAFDAAEAGFTSSVSALSLLPYYNKEKAYIVWASIASGLASLENIIAEMPQIKEAFNTYAQDIFTEIAEFVGWEKKSSDTNADILLRSLTLHAYGKYGDKTTVKKAQELFASHISGKQKIDADLRGIVFSLVAQNGGEKEWNEFYQLFAKEELHQEKNRLMMALCSFKNPMLIKKTLDWSLMKKTEFQAEHVRDQDKSRIIGLLFQNQDAKELTWDFITHNWKIYETMYTGLHGFTRLIDGAGSIAEKVLREKVVTFFATHKSKELTMTQKQVLERIDANIAWLKRDGEAIENFLKNRV